MKTLMKIHSLATGESTELDGLWLKSYDPDAHGGRGEITGTDNPEEAMKFDDFIDAMTLWRKTSKTVPVRPDGMPNRPLTAFNIEFIKQD